MHMLEHIEGTQASILIELPSQPTQRIVLMLSGISGRIFSERYNAFAKICTDAGLAIGRIEIWKGSEDVQDLTIADIHATLNKVLAYVKERGYTELFAVGKSFGGAMWLTLRSPDIKAQVLWAPAISAVKDAGSFDAYRHMTLAEVPSATTVSVDESFLSGITIPTLLIHGTSDLLVPYANSEAMASYLPHAKLVSIEGADHSYNDPAHFEKVVNETVAFLTQQ